MDELWIQAGQIRAATGGNIREIYKKLQENPQKQETASNRQTAAVTTDFMAIVMDYKLTHKTSYKDAYLAMRKAHPDIFDRWLESVQG